MANVYKINQDEEKTFNFQPPNSDEIYSLPLIPQLPISLLCKVYDYYTALNSEDVNPMEAVGLLKEIFEPYAPGVIGSLKVEQVAYLFKAYEEASKEGTSVSPMGE